VAHGGDDAVGAAVAIIYLGLRDAAKGVLSTPQMFDDRVRMAAEEALRDLAFTDSLTGIPNRAAYQALADGFAGDRRPAAVMFLDLDGFKDINDRFGHDVGDRVLRDVAQAVAGALREQEYVFRLGGDEMIVVGIGRDPLTVGEFRARVEAAVACRVATREGPITVGASCGARGCRRRHRCSAARPPTRTCTASSAALGSAGPGLAYPRLSARANRVRQRHPDEPSAIGSPPPRRPAGTAATPRRIGEGSNGSRREGGQVRESTADWLTPLIAAGQRDLPTGVFLACMSAAAGPADRTWTPWGAR
jgi:diguanylate cyclase (GGDEF)-like protein